MLNKVNRKKILIYSITIPASLAVVTGVTVGGYFVSYNSNPFLNYAKAPINSSVDAYKAVYYSYLINNANLIVLPGFSLAESMTQALLEPKYNDAAFLLIDSEYNGPSTSQVAGASFRSDQGSFVTGIAIAQYLNDHKEYFTEHDRGQKKLTWATYGGNSFSSVSSFMVGIQLGIAWFNENLASDKSLGYMPVEQVFLGNNKEDNYAMGFGPNDGDTLIDKFLNVRSTTVDCLIPVAGPQALSAANKIVAKNMRTIVIGVDSEVENDKVVKTRKLPEGKGMPQTNQVVPFSSFKNVGLMTYDILRNLQKGQSYANASNNIGGLGYQSLGTLNNNCVGVSGVGQEYFVKAMKKFYKNDASITDYDSAINKLCSIDLYQKLNTKGYRNFVIDSKNTSALINIDKYNELSKNISESSWQTYPDLPNSGQVLKAMSKEVPTEFKDNFTQADWDYKINTPNKVKQQLKLDSLNFKDRVKLTLSTPTSVLLDASFSQSCYDGISAFYYKTNNDKTLIPMTDTTQPLINLINKINNSNPIIPNSYSIPYRKKAGTK